MCFFCFGLGWAFKALSISSRHHFSCTSHCTGPFLFPQARLSGFLSLVVMLDFLELVFNLDI